jgi:hypothetical protein
MASTPHAGHAPPSAANPANADPLERYLGVEIVLDTGEPYVYLGRLVEYDTLYLLLEDADVHDLRDSKSTRELYVVESRKHGIRANRKRVQVSRRAIVSWSALTDVLA